MNHDERLVWLDLMRGLSAMAVCAGHLRAALLIDYREVEAPSLFDMGFYFGTSLGHEAVMVFFVLSGFFVGGAVIRSGQLFSWVDYGIARITRLWIVLIPALILTFLIDTALSVHAPEALSGRYHQAWNSGPDPHGGYSTGWLTALGNMFFLQTIVTPVFGSNTPLWSLANEFWYYVLFPLGALAVGQLRDCRKSARVFAAALPIAILFFLPSGVRIGYIVWLFGAALYLVAARGSPPKPNWIFVGIAIPLFIFSLLYSKSVALQAIVGLPSDLIVGAGFASLCAVVVHSEPARHIPVIFLKLSRGLSEISYSLYLSHFPFVVLIAALFYREDQLAPTAPALIIFSAWLAIIVAMAIVFWWLFERRTQTIRALIVGRLGSRRHAAALHGQRHINTAG